MEHFVNLFRTRSNDQGTEGILSYLNFFCYTLELPWKDNKRNLSCIPEGTYKVSTRYSPKYGLVYHIKEVSNRSYILIHSGNYGGDITKGLRSHTSGCILLGKKRGILNNQRAILSSRLTIKKFYDTLKGKDFKLNILEVY